MIFSHFCNRRLKLFLSFCHFHYTNQHDFHSSATLIHLKKITIRFDGTDLGEIHILNKNIIDTVKEILFRYACLSRKFYIMSHFDPLCNQQLSLISVLMPSVLICDQYCRICCLIFEAH